MKKAKKTFNYKKGFFYLFWILIFFAVYTFGIILNFQTILNNEGKMPVLSEYSDNYTSYLNDFIDNKHFYYTDNQKINYWYLSDRIHFLDRVWSIGDILIIFSSILMFFVYILMFIEKYKPSFLKRSKRLKFCCVVS